MVWWQLVTRFIAWDWNSEFIHLLERKLARAWQEVLVMRSRMLNIMLILELIILSTIIATIKEYQVWKDIPIWAMLWTPQADQFTTQSALGGQKTFGSGDLLLETAGEQPLISRTIGPLSNSISTLTLNLLNILLMEAGMIQIC